MTMFFDESNFSSKAWPASFDHYHDTNHYKEDEPSRRRWALRRQNMKDPEVDFIKYPIKSFFGSSRGRKDDHFYGRLHGIPPQAGIPGFQRITIFKFYPDNNDMFDPSSMWVYEGCVLPGNRIIVGRWWWVSPDEDLADHEIPSGPFLFWNVDESTAEPLIEKSEAMDFLEHMKQFGIGV